MRLSVRKKSFAKLVLAQREAEKLSQSQAAKEWGVSLKTLQKWEQDYAKPSPFVAQCILFYLRWRKCVPPK